MRPYLLTMFGGSLALTVAAELAAVLVYLAVAAVREGPAGEATQAVPGREKEDSLRKTARNREKRVLPGKTAAGSREKKGYPDGATESRDERDSPERTTGSRDEEAFLERAAGSRAARILLLSVLVNILTNPAAVFICWLGRMYLPLWLKWPLELAVETLVVAVEGYVYFSFREKPLWRIERPLLLSAWANGCSWLLGKII